MVMARSLTEAVVRHVAEDAGQRGLDTAQLLAIAGIDPASRPDATAHVSAAAHAARAPCGRRVRGGGDGGVGRAARGAAGARARGDLPVPRAGG